MLSRLPGQSLYDDGKLTRMLMQMQDTNNGTHMGGLGSVLQKAMMGWQMGKDMQAQTDAQDVMKRAGEAMAGTPTQTDPFGPTQAVGGKEVLPGDMAPGTPNRNLAAQLLMSNPRTAQMGYDIASQDANRAADDARWRERSDIERGWRKEDVAAQQGFQREMMGAQQSQAEKMFGLQSAQAEKMARLNSALTEGRQPLQAVPDPNNPGRFVYGRPQEGRAAVDPRMGIVGYTADGQPIMGGSGAKLSATQEKELFEADDIIRNSQFADRALTDAIKLNPQAASGVTANAKTWWQRNAPGIVGGNPEASAKTTEFNSIVTGQALDNLRAIFGGNPTEGERRILLDIQAAPNMSVEERQALLLRTQQAVQNRMAAAQAKAQGIRGRTFETQAGPLPPQPVGVGQVAAASGLTADEAAELAALRKRFGR